MRIIPKNTKLKRTVFKNFTIGDVVFGFLWFVIIAMVMISNLPFKWIIASVLLGLGVSLFFESSNGRMYKELWYRLKHLASKKVYRGKDILQIMPYTDIKDGFIEYGGAYYGGVIEISTIEFRLLSEYKQDGIINAFSDGLKLLSEGQKASLIKVDKPLIFDTYSQKTLSKMNDITCHDNNSDNSANTQLSVLKGRLSVIDELNNGDKIFRPCFFLVIYDSNKDNLRVSLEQIKASQNEGIDCKICDDKELAVFIKYCHSRGFDEREIDDIEPEKYLEWAMPREVIFDTFGTKIDGVKSYIMSISDYPLIVSNAWGAKIMDIDNTKVVLNFQPVQKDNATKRIDKACVEILSGVGNVRKLSKQNETQMQLETLQLLTNQLGNDNEALFDCTMHIVAFDNNIKYKKNIVSNNNGQDDKNEIIDSKKNNTVVNVAKTNVIKKTVKTLVRQGGYKVNELFGRQIDGFISSNISKRDNLQSYGRGIPSSTLGAIFPFVSNMIMESNGIPIGYNQYPVFIDFFKRNSKHTNSNMMIIGKSGNGKSYCVKTLLTNFRANGCRLFVLDPEQEYTILAKNMGGRVIDVGTATEGRLNPFHMTSSLKDELDIKNDSTRADNFTSFNAYLQFLESFFRSIFDGLDMDAFEYLNKLVVELYNDKGITSKTDISKLKPEQFPIFDDLYGLIQDKLKTVETPSVKDILVKLELYVSKFSGDGRNANLWNGYSTIEFNEDFVVFDFLSLLANKNNSIANAQMLLVLKILDNEIIKNMEYNRSQSIKRQIVITIDEAHTFIDQKYPVALDFMKETAKRIRKYSGMLQVITQNIKDFTGSPLIASKSSAVINACQYSIIFGLNPQDMHDLVELYSKSSPINDVEADEIVNNPRGRAFLITSPSNRDNVQIVATDVVKELFE